MAGSPHAEALGSAALDRVLTRARAALDVDRVALLLREDDALLLAAGRPGGQDVAPRVLDAQRPAVVHEEHTAAGAPVHAEGVLRGALCVCSDDPTRRFDETDLELLGDLAGVAGDLLDRAAGRAHLNTAVQAGVEALTGVLDLRDGLLARGADEAVALARRVAEQLAQAEPAVGDDLRALLQDRRIAPPAPGPF